jgi:hypothetical protein
MILTILICSRHIRRLLYAVVPRDNRNGFHIIRLSSFLDYEKVFFVALEITEYQYAHVLGHGANKVACTQARYA